MVVEPVRIFVNQLVPDEFPLLKVMEARIGSRSVDAGQGIAFIGCPFRNANVGPSVGNGHRQEPQRKVGLQPPQRRAFRLVWVAFRLWRTLRIVWTKTIYSGIVVFVTKGTPFDEFLRNFPHGMPASHQMMQSRQTGTSTSGRKLATRRWHHSRGSHVRTGDSPDGMSLERRLMAIGGIG
jgi:hypothetical protein